MKNNTWSSYTTLRESRIRSIPTIGIKSLKEGAQSSSVKSWNSFLKMASRFSSSQTLSVTIGSSEKFREVYLFISPTLVDLPLCAWKQILAYLDVTSLICSMETCKSLYHAGLNPELWQMHCFSNKIDCGPGIEVLLEKCGGDRGKWWREVYIRGILGRSNWINGNFKKRLIAVTDSKDAVTSFKIDDEKIVVGTKNRHLHLFHSCVDTFWNQNLATPSTSYQGAHKSPILCIDYVPTVGNLLASGDSDGTLGLWNIFTGELLVRHKKAHEHGISQIVVLDSKHIATCGFDKMARIFRLQDISLESHSTSSNRSSKSDLPRKKTSILKRLFRKKDLLLKPRSSVTIIREFRGHRGEIYCMKALLSGKVLATGATDHKIMVNYLIM
jgi:hypothetical protein